MIGDLKYFTGFEKTGFEKWRFFSDIVEEVRIIIWITVLVELSLSL